MAAESRTIRLTATGYSILGLLALGDWSAYELAQLMHRSVGLILPRADSVIYEEPKRLVRTGLATGRAVPRGQRQVTVYRITRKGRLALDEWVASPADPPQLDSETIVKILFQTSPSTDAIRSHIAALRHHTAARLDELHQQNAEYLRNDGPFPQRLAVIALTGRFVIDYYQFLLDWCRWAETQLDAGPLDKQWAMSVFQEVARNHRPD